MIRLLLISGLATLIGTAVVAAAGLDGPVRWMPVAPGFEATEAGTVWNVKSPYGSKARSFQFTAIRVHLGYFQIRLADVNEFARSNAQAIAKDQKLDPSLPALFELGVTAIFRASGANSHIVAVGPAGFPMSSRNLSNRGLLRINGVDRAPLLLNGPSAILCLDNPPSADYQYQVPTFYRTSVVDQSAAAARCKDVVQTGPRILEDPSRFSEGDPGDTKTDVYQRKVNGKSDPLKIYLGVTPSASNATSYLRSAFAIDDPGRIAGQGETNAQRKMARNAYLVVTTSPASFLDLQDLFKSPEFYANEAYGPRWAINLPGDEYAAMAYAGSIAGEAVTLKEVGGVGTRQPSALVFELRK